MSTVPPTPPAQPAAPAPVVHKKDPIPQRVVLVAYPKIVFLYPTFVASLAAGIGMAIYPELQTSQSFLISTIFMCVLALNLLVFSFDFPRETSLALAAFIIAVVFGMMLLFRSYATLWPWITEVLTAYHPAANATFFFSIASLLGIIYLFVLVSVQFDYWEVTPNELLHHHGLMSDMKRFPSANMRIDKEINDVFENLLLGSGRLILHPHDENRTIVLDNVMRINTKERNLMKMLGALKVQIAGR